MLVSPRNPLNIGAAARALSNFGFESLRLVQAYRDAVEEARSGVNASPLLAAAREFATVREAVADCELVYGTGSMDRREQRHPLDRLDEAAARMATVDGHVALVFGSEKHGLSKDDFTYCQRSLRIPTRQAHGSMNLGQAVAVCAYELSRAAAFRHASDHQISWGLSTDPSAHPSTRQTSSDPQTTSSPQTSLAHPDPLAAQTSAHRSSEVRATAADLDRLAGLLHEALSRSGYPQTASADEKVRHLVRRLDLRPGDAEAWQGMVRQILWKLRDPRNE